MAREIAAYALGQPRRDVRWFQEVRDMLDGKPRQTLKHDGSEESPITVDLHVEFFDSETEKPEDNPQPDSSPA